MLYFHLMEEGEEKGRKKEKEKKITMGEEGFPGGWTCLAGCAAGRSC
jgi:hypothetical protein